jgi:hypothetical protein
MVTMYTPFYKVINLIDIHKFDQRLKLTNQRYQHNCIKQLARQAKNLTVVGYRKIIGLDPTPT